MFDANHKIFSICFEFILLIFLSTVMYVFCVTDFSVFCSKMWYFAVIMLTAASIELCSKFCRQNLSKPMADCAQS